jgi:hypothetical protein
MSRIKPTRINNTACIIIFLFGGMKVVWIKFCGIVSGIPQLGNRNRMI